MLAPTAQAALRPVTRLGLPAVLTVHSVWGEASRLFAAADAVVGWSRWPVRWSAVSEMTAEPIRRILRSAGAAADVAVLPNGLDLDAWRVPRTERGARPEGSAVHVVAAARFAPRKRMLPLLAAIADAASRLPDARAVRDPRRRRPAARGGAAVRRGARAARRRLPARTAHRHRAQAALRARRRLAAPSPDEAFGIAALEAQAAGLTVIAHSGSGVAERVVDGATGLLVPDDDALTAALVRLATEPGLLDGLLARAATPPSGVDWPEVLAATERAYAEAAMLARRDGSAARPFETQACSLCQASKRRHSGLGDPGLVRADPVRR